MKTFYVITNVDYQNFWSHDKRQFLSYLFAKKFESKESLLIYAKKECIGVFKITKVYDTK